MYNLAIENVFIWYGDLEMTDEDVVMNGTGTQQFSQALTDIASRTVEAAMRSCAGPSTPVVIEVDEDV